MSPKISRTAVLASTSVVAAGALVFGAVAAASAAPQPRAVAITSSSSSAAPSGVTADITVTIEADDDVNPASRVIAANDVPVGDDVELDFAKGEYVNIESPDFMCVGFSVDIDLDPQAVDIYEDSGDCSVEVLTSVKVEITLTGASFGTVTLTSDNLFTSEVIEVPEEEIPDVIEGFGGLSGNGSFRCGPSFVTALDAPFPVLTALSASGSRFVALWSGSQFGAVAGGSANFSFALAAAPGATPVLASPVLTG